MNYLILSYHINKIGADGIGNLSWNEDQQESSFTNWLKEDSIDEVLYLSTCNRVEFIFYTKDALKLMEKLPSLLIVDSSNARIYSEAHSVVQHLLEVGLSMDSLVFGENQILGQIKICYQRALKKQYCSSNISYLIQNILKHTKAIRTKNHLSNIHNTVSTVAGKDFLLHSKDNGPILLVGAGESNQLLARYLIKRSFRNFIWTNRTDSKAESAAKNFGGTSISWEKFITADLPKVDACFLTTNAGKEIFHLEHLQTSKPDRLYDLSIPPNANQELTQKSGTQYIGLDLLNEILEKEKARYDKLRKIISSDIKKSVLEIHENLNSRTLNPIISESLGNIDRLVNSAMTDLPNSLEQLSDKQKEALRLWTRSLVQKTKHEHITQLKKLKKDRNGNLR